MDKDKLAQLGLGTPVGQATTTTEIPQGVLPDPEEVKEDCPGGVCAVPESALAPVDEFDPFAFDMEDMLNGVEARYPFVKFPQGSTAVFTVGDENPKELVGTIIYHHRQNVYYEKPFSERTPEDEKAPDCQSSDGVTGINRHTGECVSCADCPLNQFVNNQKACANKIRLYFAMAGTTLPYIVDLPPTSIGAYQNYLNQFIGVRKNPFQFLTSIKLEKGKSAGGIEYCKAVFSRLEEHPRELAIEFYQQRMALKESLR